MDEKIPTGKIVDLGEARRQKEVEDAAGSEDREVDVIDELESYPNHVFEQLAQNLDLETQSAATILTMLRIAKKKGIHLNENEIKKVTQKFKINQEHSLALFNIRQDLMALSQKLREQVGEQIYFDEVLPETTKLEAELKKESHFILTGGEEDESA